MLKLHYDHHQLVCRLFVAELNKDLKQSKVIIQIRPELQEKAFHLLNPPTLTLSPALRTDGTTC